MQTCGRCKQSKLASDFPPSARKHGMWCRACNTEYQGQWRKHNPDAYRRSYMKSNAGRLADPLRRARAYAWNNEKRRRDKAEVFTRLGDRCACCGETERTFLQIDHVNNDGAAHRKRLGAQLSNRNQWSGAQFRLYAEIRDGKTEGLQLLCANCNWGKAINGGICPHEEKRMATAALSA